MKVSENYIVWGGEKGSEKYDYAAKALNNGHSWRVDVYEGTQPFDRCIGTIYGIKDVATMPNIMTLDELKSEFNIVTGSIHLEDRRFINEYIVYLDEDGDEEERVTIGRIPRLFGGPGFYYSHEALQHALGLAIDILAEDYTDMCFVCKDDYTLKCKVQDERFCVKILTTDREEWDNANRNVYQAIKEI